MKTKNEKQIFGLLFVPFIINYALVMVISGESNWGPYNIAMQGFQVRLLGVLIIFFCFCITYDVILKNVQSSTNEGIVKEILKIFFSSLFFY